MAKNKSGTFTSILDRIAKELGEAPKLARFNDEKIDFFETGYRGPVSWESMTPISKNALDNEWSVGTQNRETVTTNQVDDGNKNLQLPASSTIQSAAYWIEKEYLVVSFKSGGCYDYQNVPPETIKAWENAASAGSYFYYNIRMSFSYKKLG